MLSPLGVRSALATALAVGVLFLWTVSPSDAASVTVNQTTDAPDAAAGGACDVDLGTAGDQCTLRAAIQAANASGAGPHTITLPAGTYTLTLAGHEDAAANGDLDVTSAIVINGAGAGTTFVQVVTCTRSSSIVPGGFSPIALTVAVSGSAPSSVTNTATVAAANELNTTNNSASDPTTVVAPPPCSIRRNVGVQVTHTGPGTGPGLLRATLTANTAPGLTSNGITKVKILLATNAALDGLNGQNNLTSGEVSLATVPSTTFTVRRLAAGAFTVQIEVTDACGTFKTLVGGGTSVT